MSRSLGGWLSRVLVDRLWPWGLSRERLQGALWLKEVAPGSALRQWFGHDPAKFVNFRRRYIDKLSEKPEVVAGLCSNWRTKADSRFSMPHVIRSAIMPLC